MVRETRWLASTTELCSFCDTMGFAITMTRWYLFSTLFFAWYDENARHVATRQFSSTGQRAQCYCSTIDTRVSSSFSISFEQHFLWTLNASPKLCPVARLSFIRIFSSLIGSLIRSDHLDRIATRYSSTSTPARLNQHTKASTVSLPLP